MKNRRFSAFLTIGVVLALVFGGIAYHKVTHEPRDLTRQLVLTWSDDTAAAITSADGEAVEYFPDGETAAKGAVGFNWGFHTDHYNASIWEITVPETGHWEIAYKLDCLASLEDQPVWQISNSTVLNDVYKYAQARGAWDTAAEDKRGTVSGREITTLDEGTALRLTLSPSAAGAITYTCTNGYFMLKSVRYHRHL